MNKNLRNVKQAKAIWRANLRTRTNGGKTGRISERKPRPKRGE